MADSNRWDVVVIGGASTDYLVRGKRLPGPGETVSGDIFHASSGGKGVNQALAAARLGARVAFVGRVGDDNRGAEIIAGLEKEGVDTAYVTRTPHYPTGVALVMVNEEGEKQTLTTSGANYDLRLEDIERASGLIRSANVLLSQLEVPLNMVEAALRIAQKSSVRTVLDPTPAQPLPHSLLRHVDIICPNAGDAQTLTGFEPHNRHSAGRAAQALLSKGVLYAIVQAGNEGNLLVWADDERLLPHIPSGAADAAFAGDSFAGTLAAELARGTDLVTAVTFAGAASGLAAKPPTHQEVHRMLKDSRAA